MYQIKSADRPATNINTIADFTNIRNAYSYDYVTALTNEKFAMEHVDCYEALGFELVKSEKAVGLKTALTFKRDRKLKDKEQLNKIQVKLDEALSSINKLEQNKAIAPFTASVALGTAGAGVLGGGISLGILSGTIGAIIGGIALGLAGLGIAGLGYLAYKRLYTKKTARTNPLMDKKRDAISQLCEEAQKYLR